jgi:ABC-2 type transport system permease protein
VLFLVALGFGFWPIYQKAGGGNYIEFLAPWIICMSILFTSLFAGIEVIRDKQFGFLKETLVAPVSRLNIMIGRTLGGSSIAIFQWVLVLLISMAVWFRPENRWMLVVAFLFMFLVSLLFTALGTAIASVMDDMQWFQLVMNFLVMPLFFLSWALFPMDSFPSALRIVSSFDPLSYGVDGIRWALTGISYYGIFQDFMILSIITIVFLVIGTYLFSKIEV